VHPAFEVRSGPLARAYWTSANTPRTPGVDPDVGRILDYPRAGRRGVRRFVPSWRLVLGTAAGVLLLLFGGLAVAYAEVDVPDPNNMVTAQSSVVYWSDGKTELGRFSDVGGNRQSIPLSEVPESAQHAVLAAEDRSFYQNKGISPKGIGRALWVKLSGGSTQGGSTITQQYVKNYFLTQDRTASRKLREFVIALKIEQTEGKQRILENYLNTIYFGRGAYGIERASQAYFKHPASELTVSEGALLAAVIRSPGLYDPVTHRDRAAQRVDYVLDGMVQQGWLSQADRAKQTFPKLAKRRTKNVNGGTKGYLLDAVRAEVRTKLGLTDDDIDRGGLKIVSTFQRKAQRAAVDAVDEELPSSRSKGVRAGLVAIKPDDGAVVAMYGGNDSVQEPLNAATQATMQAGSTFKPFALMAALEDGVSLRSRYDGSSPRWFHGTKVSNFGGESLGRMDLLEATAKSVNTVYVDLNDQVGPARTRKTAVEAGYPSTTRGLEDNLANVLGTASPRVIDVADAFATFAAEGKHAAAYTVKRVTSQDGKIDYRADVRPKRVFSRDSSRDLTYALQGVVQRGSGSYAGVNLGRPAAGKTGTSQDNKSAWFAGYTPQLAAAIGMYRGGVKDGQAVQRSLNGLGGLDEVTGGTIPVRVWTAFMKGALEGTDVEDFPAPAFGGRSNVPLSTSTFTSSSTSTGGPSSTSTRTRTESPSSSPTSSSTSRSESSSSTSSPTTRPTTTRTTSSPTRSRRPTTSPTTSPGDGGGNRSRGATRTQRPTTSRPTSAGVAAPVG
jgi:membrane peptidoglycan carboxypeptidase